MPTQLKTAREQLREALDSYLRACSIVRGSRVLGKPHLPLEFTQQMDNELAFISSCESKMQQAKHDISHTRNSNYSPINALPAEILAHIFLLCRPRSCDIHLLPKDTARFLRYPDYLGHVCSSWRTLALSSPVLWSHIDLSTNRIFCHKLLTRAKTYVARAGKIPIALHVAGDPDSEMTSWASQRALKMGNPILYQFIERVATRVESLELVIAEGSERFPCEILEVLSTSPMVALKRLVIRCDTFVHSNEGVLMRPQRAASEKWDEFLLWLSIAPTQIENMFLPLKVLHLQGIFPRRSSPMYRGLLDLRLSSTPCIWSTIRRSTLITVLKSSPELRILYFELDLLRDHPSSGGTHTGSVELRDLQVVKLSRSPSSRRGDLQMGTLLRLLAPGSKPLQLSIDFSTNQDAESLQELERFFARSKVAGFYYGWGAPPIDIIIQYASHLETVELAYCDYNCSKSLQSFQAAGQAPLAHLDSFYLTEDGLGADSICSMLNLCPTGVVLRSPCRVTSGVDNSEELSKEEIAKRFPTVRTTPKPDADHLLDIPMACLDNLK